MCSKLSPILTIQKKLRTAGRIRTGAKVATKSGGSRPSKLASFRFTSADKFVIEAVAEVYGGDVQPWDGGVGSQWEVYAGATELNVILPPTDIAFSQFFEEWTGGRCNKRCDGEINVLTDSPCDCNPDDRLCKPTTRLNVILSEIEGIGVFRLESHGYNSAAELGGSIDVLKTLQHRGQMVPGRLLLEQRKSTRLDPTTGKTETFSYAVPTLDLKINVAELASGSENGRTAIGVTPIHQPEDLPPIPSVTEQLQAAQNTPERPKRSNAAAPLPKTGLKPRGMPAVAEAPDKPDKPAAPTTTAKPDDDKTPGGASKRSVKRLFAVLNGRTDIEKTDAARHAWARRVLGLPADSPISFNDLNQKAITALNDVAQEVPFASAPTLASTIDETPF